MLSPRRQGGSSYLWPFTEHSWQLAYSTSMRFSETLRVLGISQQS